MGAESFEEVNTDEAYVEGRWSGTDHKKAVDTGSSGWGFSTAVINIIKQGAVYPDQNANWSRGHKYPWWHGRWHTTDETVKKADNHSKLDWDVNYVAVIEMVSEIALEGGEIRSYMTYDWFRGMLDTYKELKRDLNALKNEYKTILSSNTKANRMYFLFGCAIHYFKRIERRLCGGW